MSIRLMSSVFSGRFQWGPTAPTEPIVKLVLLALADHASDSGEAVYPSLARVQAKTGLSRQSVKNVITAARERGVLQAIGRRRQVIEYRIALDQTGIPGSPAPGYLVARTGIPGSPVSIIETSKTTSAAIAAPAPRTRPDPLDTFARWQQRAAKGEAPHIIAAKFRRFDLLALVEAFEAVTGMQMGAQPATVQKRWLREIDEWAQAGVTPAEVREAYALTRGDRKGRGAYTVAAPGSLNSALSVVRSKQPVKAEPAQNWIAPQW